jgi:phosphate uptake regulator
MIELIQMVIIIGIIIMLSVALTFVNLKKKIITPVNKEQSSWQRIEALNSQKKELLRKKEELSYKYSAKSISDDSYSNNLKNITTELTKIDTEINNEVSTLTELQKTPDVGSDLRFQNIKLKGELSETKLERDNLKNRIKELEDFIKNLSGTKNLSTSIRDNIQNKYYEQILDKYKDLINEQERKTISQIKATVNPNDLTIKSIISKHKPVGYEYNKDYIETLRKIYSFLKTEIDVVKTDIKVLYWLDATCILKNKLADEQDASGVLCSAMQGLNDQEAMVYVVLLDDDKTHAFVKTKYKNQFYIFDLTQKGPFEMFTNADEKKLLDDYKFNGLKIKKIIYRYNQNNYIDTE